MSHEDDLFQKAKDAIQRVAPAAKARPLDELPRVSSGIPHLDQLTAVPGGGGFPKCRLILFRFDDGPPWNDARPRLMRSFQSASPSCTTLVNPDQKALAQALKDEPNLLLLDNWHAPSLAWSGLHHACLRHTRAAVIAFSQDADLPKAALFSAYLSLRIHGDFRFTATVRKNSFAASQGWSTLILPGPTDEP